jgi:hypothetical protein
MLMEAAGCGSDAGSSVSEGPVELLFKGFEEGLCRRGSMFFV